MNIRAVFFDLDGTLADTAPELAAALNAVRAEEGLPPLPYAAIRPVVSHGGTALVRLGFPDSAGERLEALRQRLLDHYRAGLGRATPLFPGMDRLLERLEAQGRPWGVVTNKPAWLTEPLMAALGLAERARAIVSGDTCAQRKPHPEPLLHACRQTGVPPAACLYLGDAERDIQAGRAAGMQTAVAHWGYLDEHDRPATWGAHHHLHHPLDTLELLT